MVLGKEMFGFKTPVFPTQAAPKDVGYKKAGSLCHFWFRLKLEQNVVGANKKPCHGTWLSLFGLQTEMI
ncbi:MAG: hypothetical protein Rhob2KO_11880 [Rhodopirellula baltica]